MRLNSFSQYQEDIRILVDSNYFLYSALAHKKYGIPCTDLLTQVENGNFSGFVPTIVIQEVLHRLMITEVQKNTGIHGITEIRKHIQSDPDIIRSLSYCFEAVERIPEMGFRLIGDSPEIIHGSIEMTKKYSLFAKDAVIVSSASTYGILTIASIDRDFERVPWLKIYRPNA